MCIIQDRVNELTALAGISVPVEARIDLVGRCAGQCDGYGKYIRINKVLLGENLKEELDQTIIHEMAHAVDIQRNGYRRDSRCRAIHHDEVFYTICAELGDPNASRTHKIAELRSSRVYRKFRYLCECGENHTLKTPSHNKLQAGKVTWYQFTACKGKVYKETFICEVTK